MAVTNYYTVNGRILAESTGGVRTTYGRDALGSTVSTFDSTGAVQNTYRYSPYGTSLIKSGTASDPKFVWNGSSGYRTSRAVYAAVYVRARHYDRVSGRWSTVDALWPRKSAYGYVLCSPSLRTDPSGRGETKPPQCPECVIGDCPVP